MIKQDDRRGSIWLTAIEQDDGTFLYPTDIWHWLSMMKGEEIAMEKHNDFVRRMEDRVVRIDEETRNFNIKPQLRSNCCSQVMIEQLVDMAVNGEVPGGYYSDFECDVWSTIRAVLTKNGVDIGKV